MISTVVEKQAYPFCQAYFTAADQQLTVGGEPFPLFGKLSLTQGSRFEREFYRACKLLVLKYLAF
jgi:hypothetical protein